MNEVDEQKIVLRALDLSTDDERVSLLDAVCGLGTPLRQRVETLLRLHQQPADVPEESVPELAATLVPVHDRSEPLDHELASDFRESEAVAIGHSGQSVLQSLGQICDVPRLVLRETEVDGGASIVRPTPTEIPDRNSESRYRLEGEIARGGMGAILKGRDIDLGRDLAIKVLLDRHRGNPEVVQRFIEEAQIGGQLQHPGIAPVYELGQFADRRPFFSMKLVKGQTLAKLLADRAEHSADRGRFLGIFEQVCQTVAYAHSRGVIHRDLKPANIMVGAFGEVQVMDWGLAKVLSAGGNADGKQAHHGNPGQSLIHTLRSGAISDPSATPDARGTFGSTGSHTLMGSVMGTPAYMPPEQALGEIDLMDERADVFGLGAILCEILTGTPPYVGTDGTDVLRQAVRGKLDPCLARLDVCQADGDLIFLTKHCLNLEPKDRPRDASVLASRVSGYLQSVEKKLRITETERAVQAERVEQQQHSARKLRKLIAGLAVVAAIAVGTSLIAGKFWQDATVAKLSAEKSAGLAQSSAAAAEVSKATAQREARHATEQKRLAEENLNKAKQAETVATEQRDLARQAQFAALDQTYLATRNEIRSMRLARQPGWRSAALERLRDLVKLGSRNLDRVDLRTEALACLSEMDVKIQSKFASDNHGIWHIRYSPDGRTLAMNSNVGSQVELRDLTTNQNLPSIPKSAVLAPFAFHPGGSLVVPTAAGRVAYFPLHAGHPIFPEITGDGHALNLAFSRSGDRLAIIWGDVDLSNAGYAKSVRRVTVHDTATGTVLWAVDLPTSTRGDYKVALAISPDGRSLATIGPDADVHLYSVGEDKKPIVLGKLDIRICAIDFHPDGQSLAAAGRLVGAVWDLKSHSELLRVHAPEGGFWDIAYSPDGHLLGGVCNDMVVKLWDSRTGRELMAAPTETSEFGLSMAFSPDGTRFAVGGGSTTLYELQGRNECRSDASAINYVGGIDFETTRPALISCEGDGRIRHWLLNESAPTLLRRTSHNINSYVIRLAPDSSQFALGFIPFGSESQGLDLSILAGRLDNEKVERRLQGPRKRVFDLDFNKTGRRLAGTSADHELYVWDFESGKLLYQVKIEGVKTVRFLNENELVVSAGDSLILLAATDGTIQRELRLPDISSDFVVTPDRKAMLVVTVDGMLHRVSLPDLLLTNSRMAVERPTNLSLSISHDGSLLAVSTQAEQRNLLIETRTLQPLARLPQSDTRVTRILFDHQGLYLATCGARITLWNLALIRGELLRIGLDFSASTPTDADRR